MKKIVCLLFCVVMALSVLAACQPEHEHTFNTTWQYDSAEHWKQATCEHTDVVSERAPHVDDDENDLCDVCGCAMGHEHKWESTWTQGEKTHYYKPTCGCADEPKYRKDEADHADANNDGLCDVCKYDYGHKHTYADAWTATEGGHWHAPTCGHDVDGADKAAHADSNNDGACDACGDNGGHEHTYAEDWTSDENNHWHAPTCGHQVPGSDKAAHVDTDADGKCDVCAFVPEHFHRFEDGWTADKTGHWHKAACEHTDQIDGFEAHTGYEEDGICDVCEYLVMYTVTFQAPDYVKVVDDKSNELTGPFLVMEGEQLVVYLAVPDYAKLELVEGAAYETEGVLMDNVYLYKVTVTPTENTTVTAAVNKLKAVEVIVDGGIGVFNAEKMGFLYQTITFQAPAAGKYAVYCLDNGNIHFAAADAVENINDSPFQHEYLFEVTEAGEFSLQCRFFAWDKGEAEFTYYVVKLEEEMVLPYMQGSGYTMPTNAPVDVTFTLPAPGLYHITSSWAVEWNGSLEDCLIECTEAGQKVVLSVRFVSDQYVTFDFDWEIRSLNEGQDMTEGKNEITASPNKYLPLEFTATQTGTYKFTAEHKDLNIHYWGPALWGEGRVMRTSGQTYEVKLNAGDTIMIFVLINRYTEPPVTTDITSGITAEFLGYVPTEGENGYEVLTNHDAIYVNNGETGDYQFVLPEGAQISFDYGKTWNSGTVIKTLEAGQKVAYRVKGANGETVIILNITQKHYAFNLAVGNNQVTLIPGKDYSVTLSGSASTQMTTDYILTWSDPDVIVSYMGQVLTSPAKINAYSSWRSSISITYKGSAEKTVTFKLEDGYVPPDPTLVLGENAVEVTDIGNGYYKEFTAEVDGVYTLSYAKGETNGEIMVGGDIIDLPYAVELKAGEKLAITVFTLDWTVDTIDLVLTMEEKDYSAMLPQLNGTYDVNFQMDKLYQLTFQPDAEGAQTGKLILVDNDADSVELGGTYKYSFGKNTGVVITKTDGTPANILIGMDKDGNLTVKCGSLTAFQVLERHTHTFSVNWTVTEKGHYHAATCGCDEKADFAAHADSAEDQDELCDVCGYDMHVHSFQLSHDEKEHWQVCACGEKKDAATHADGEDEDELCDTCGFDMHQHRFSEDWSSDENYHWHACACGEISAKGVHVDNSEPKDGFCDVCALEIEHIHDYASEWSMDETGHWHAATCEHADVIIVEPHTYDEDYKCTVCGYQHTHTYEEAWTDAGEDGHYHKTTCGHDVKNLEAHAEGETVDEKCDTCGHNMHVHAVDESVWHSDLGSHWNECACGDRFNEGQHFGFERDGVCDLCQQVVFELLTVTIKHPEGTQISIEGQPITGPIGSIIPGDSIEFDITIPDSNILKSSELYSFTFVSHEAGKTTYHIVATINVGGELEIEMEKLAVTATPVEGLGGTFEYEMEGGYGYVEGQFDLTVTEPGTYVVYMNSGSENGYVAFGIAADQVNFSSYTFTAEGEKTITLFYTCSAYAEGVSYGVAKLTSNGELLPYASGTGYELPCGMMVPVTVKLPAAGAYYFSANGPWYDANGEYLGEGFIYTATERTLTFQGYVMTYGSEGDSDSFVWNAFELKTSGEVVVGENQLTVPAEGYYGVTFTAKQEATYRFAWTNGSVLAYEYTDDGSGTYNLLGVYGTHVQLPMTIGQQVVLYFRSDSGEALQDTLTVSNLGYVPQEDYDAEPDENWNYPFAAKVGVVNSYIVYNNADYTFTPVNGQISLDGETWTNSITVTGAEGDVLQYYVKADTDAQTVHVYVTKTLFEFEMWIYMADSHENIVTMKPGVEYTGIIMGASWNDGSYHFTLNWTDTDVAVFLEDFDGNRTPVASGEELVTYWGHKLIVINNGDAARSVTLTTTNIPESGGDTADAGVLVEGVNTFNFDSNDIPFLGSEVLSFTAEAAGTYHILLSDGYFVEGDMYNTPVDGVMTKVMVVTLEAGETVTFYSYVDDFSVMTMTITVTRAMGVGTHSFNYNENDKPFLGTDMLVFVAPEAGTYEITLTDAYFVEGDMYNTPVGGVEQSTITVTLEAGEAYCFYTYVANYDVMDMTITIAKV